MLTREQILNVKDLKTESVLVPEWGDGAVLKVRTLTAAEFLVLSGKIETDKDRAYAHWIVASVVDDEGKCILTEDDVTALAEKSFPVIQRILEAAQKLNLKDGPAKN